jgi:lysozyme family protein
MSYFDQAIPSLLEHEGPAVVPDDHGRGPSKYGVTLETYREYFPEATADSIKALTPQLASAFFRRMFWERYRIALIEDQALATKLLDLAVNIGGATAIKLLQHAVGTKEDGVLGPETAKAVNLYGATGVLCTLRALAGLHYYQIVKDHPEYAGCLQEWITRLNT